MSMAKLLVVDDDPENREIVVAVLRNAGHEVEEAASVDEALERIARRRFDQILSDVLMPGRTGLELARILREESGAPPIVLMSGTSNEQEAKANGAAGFLAKPIAVDDLLAAIH